MMKKKKEKSAIVGESPPAMMRSMKNILDASRKPPMRSALSHPPLLFFLPSPLSSLAVDYGARCAYKMLVERAFFSLLLLLLLLPRTS